MHPLIRNFKPLLLLVALLLAPAILAQNTDAHLRIDPHHYQGPRGSEPQNQLVIQGKLDTYDADSKFPWRVLSHGDFETLGRKENSIDVDRAYVSYGNFTAGRIHPYDMSHHPAATRPWGLVAQSQAQNRSILLGSPTETKVFPEPILQGWIGAHYWSDNEHTKNFQWGLSATPVFIPSMGSAVNYHNPVSSRVGRFGRQPPGYVELNHRRYPIEYRIDDSEVMKEVLQPQVMAQSYYGLKNSAFHWETWVAVQRAPSLDPELKTSAVLDIRESTPKVVTTVKPTFPQQWSSNVTQKLTPQKFLKDYSLFSSLQWHQGGKRGAEIGAESQFFQISYLNEWRAPKPVSDYQWDEAYYSDHLVQLESRLKLSRYTVYGGGKMNLFTYGAWVRGGVRSAVTDNLDVDLGMDMFNGSRTSYFGEWKSNSRVYLSLNWRLGA